MTLNERIKYWSGRAAVARRADREEEAELCEEIVATLSNARKAVRRAQSEAKRIVARAHSEVIAISTELQRLVGKAEGEWTE